MQQSRRSLGLIKGRKAKEFRKEVASMAVSLGKGTMRAIPFPLDMDIPKSAWPSIEHDCNITAGVEPVSLRHLLLTMSTSGFRMFHSASARRAWQLSSVMGDGEFARAWLEQMERLENNAGTLPPSALYVLLAKRPRKTARRNVTEQVEAPFLAEDFRKEISGGGELMDRVATAVGNAIAAEFETWAEMNINPIRCGELVDAVFTSFDLDLPSIKEAFEAAAAEPSSSDKYQKSTIAFDSDLAHGEIANEYLPHLMCAIYLKDHKDRELPGKPSDHIKNSVLTANMSALSWLFGKGIEYFASTSPAVISKDMGIPAERMGDLERVRQAAAAIEEPAAFNNSLYANSRASLGGGVSSWVENYTKRIFSLQSAVAKMGKIELPDLNDEPYAKELYGALSANGIHQLASKVQADISSAGNALNRLTGNVDDLPSEADVNAISQLNRNVEALAGAIDSLNERLLKAGQEDSIIELPAWASRMEKLNRFGGGLRDYKKELDAAREVLSITVEARDQHFRKLVSHYGFDALSLSALDNIGARGGKGSDNQRIQGARNILHRVLRVGREVSDHELFVFIKRWAQGLQVTRKTYINKFFDHKQGAFWQSRYNKARHHVYRMDHRRLADVDVIMEARKLIDKLDQAFPQHIEVEKLRSTYMTILLAGMPPEVPHDLAQPKESMKDIIHIDPLMRLRMDEDEVSRDVVISLIGGRYGSVISGKLAELKRTGFMVNAVFGAYTDPQTCYAPKPVAWKPPARMIALIEECGMEIESQSGVFDAIDLARTAISHLNSKGIDDDIAMRLRNLLRQIPHDWMADPRLAGVGEERLAASFGDNVGKLRNMKGLVRLVGPSSVKAALDDAMSGSIRLGASSLVVRKRVGMRYSEGEVNLETKRIHAELHVIVKESALETAAGNYPNIMGIDLGMYGFGYSVMNPESGELVAEGVIPTRRAKLLVERVAQYRRRKQPKQRYGAVMDTPLANAREQAAAEVISLIDGLIHKYQAHPIVEADLGKGRTGSGAQLATVFDTITRHFTYSNTQAHSALRKQHWQGADRWQHQMFVTPKKSGRKKVLSPTTAGKDLELQNLSMFPGASIGSYGTTTKCSCCGRDPVESTRGMKEAIKTSGEGMTRIPDGKIQLVFKNTPLADKKIAPDDINRTLRSCMLRPLGTSKKHSRKAEYRCLYTDCGESIHSEVNSARNIARKWLDKQADLSGKFQQWDSLTKVEREELVEARV